MSFDRYRKDGEQLIQNTPEWTVSFINNVGGGGNRMKFHCHETLLRAKAGKVRPPVADEVT